MQVVSPSLSISVYINTGFPLGRLGNMVSELGQCFGGAQTNASWNSNPLQDALSDLTASLSQVTSYAGEIDEALVNRINFLTVPKTGSNAHHAVTQVSIRSEV